MGYGVKRMLNGVCVWRLAYDVWRMCVAYDAMVYDAWFMMLAIGRCEGCYL